MKRAKLETIPTILFSWFDGIYSSTRLLFKAIIVDQSLPSLSYKGNGLIAYSDVYGLVGVCVSVSVWRSCRAQIPGSPYYNPASA